eukprot:gene4766-5226_t
MSLPVNGHSAFTASFISTSSDASSNAPPAPPASTSSPKDGERPKSNAAVLRGKGILQPLCNLNETLISTLPLDPLGGDVEIAGRVLQKRSVDKQFTLAIAPLIYSPFNKFVCKSQPTTLQVVEGQGIEEQRNREEQLVSLQVVVGNVPILNLNDEEINKLYKVIRRGDVVRARGKLALATSQTERVSPPAHGVPHVGLELDLQAEEMTIYEDVDNLVFSHPSRHAKRLVATTEITTAASIVEDDQEESIETTAVQSYLTLTDTLTNRFPLPSLPFSQVQEVQNEEGSTSGNVEVTVVDGVASVTRFADAIESLLTNLSEETNEQGDFPRRWYNPNVVGIDTEWRPWFIRVRSKSAKSNNSLTDPSHAPAETLQLSLRDEVFIIDLSTLCNSSDESLRSSLNETLGKLLRHPGIYKLGYEIMGDLDRLAASYGSLLPSLLRWNAAMDVSPMARVILPGEVSKKNAGLSRVCSVLFGKGLDKTQQCSAWHLRPLTPQQIAYGALDAAVLIKVYDGLINRIHKQYPMANIDRYFEKQSFIFNAKFRVEKSFPAVTDVKEEPDINTVQTSTKKGKRLIGSTVFTIKWPRHARETFWEEEEKPSF